MDDPFDIRETSGRHPVDGGSLADESERKQPQRRTLEHQLDSW
jgi:hypothetical protein